MLKIWLLIIFGVVIVPLISSATRELEEKLDDENAEILGGKIMGREDVRQSIKLLTYLAVGIVITIAIIIVLFIRNIMLSN